jgi:hypothetical protein
MAIQKPVKRPLSSYGRLGALLAIIGGVLAVDSITGRPFTWRLWPLLATVLGIGFIGIYAQRSRRETVYVGLGSFIIGFSALALYCNFTSWSGLSHLWPVFIALTGISMILGFFLGSRRSAVLLTGLIFVSLAIVFYLVFNLDHRFWWLIFILTGGSFLVFDRVRHS